MNQAQARSEDLRLETERRLICKGAALVRFEHLRWNDYTKRNPAKRQPDPQHVKRIQQSFSKVGCRPLYVLNHIPAIVSQQQLDGALEDARQGVSRVPIENEVAYPELAFPSGIECLHGLHRIEAAKEWLRPVDKWWIVDLYLSPISEELSTILNEEYSNKESPCDGEIYRKIREYQCLPRQADCQLSPATCVSFEMLWWATLSKSREAKLRNLFANKRKNRRIAATFDALSKIPSLFDAGMIVTTLNKVLATKSYEEICHYNEEYILKAWVGFMKGVENGYQRIDKNTVEAVEMRAPGVSTLDARRLQEPVHRGAIFSAFSHTERATIWENMLAYKGIIPSLSKFFQDIHLLQACVNSIRWLVTVPPDETVFSALRDAYNQKDTQLVQTSDTSYRSEAGSRLYCMRLGYLGLFAFALRYYRHLPKAPRKKGLKEMPRAAADRHVLQRFANFAYQSGFSTPEIQELKEGSELEVATGSPRLLPISITTGPGEDVKRRCGLPCTHTFHGDRNYLYLDNLCRGTNEIGEGITSFFVLKCFFQAFFGQWPPNSSTESSNPLPWPPDLRTEILGPLPQVHHRIMDGEDVRMGEERPEIPDQRVMEPERLDTDGQMQGIAAERAGEPSIGADEQMQEAGAETITEPSIEAGGTIQQDNTLFVPAGSPKPRSTEKGTGIEKIRFARVPNIKQTLDPSREYPDVEWVEVEHGDPQLHVKFAASKFRWKEHRGAYDKNKRGVPSEDCYYVATREGNNMTIFMVLEEDSQTETHRPDATENRGQVTAEPREQEVEQNRLGDNLPTGTLEVLHHPRDEPDATVLNNEIKKAAERTWVSPLSLPTGDFDFRSGDFHLPPFPAPSQERLPLVDTTEGVHRDKIGGRLRKGFGKSFQQEEKGIRRKRGKLTKPQDRGARTTPDPISAERDSGEDIG